MFIATMKIVEDGLVSFQSVPMEELQSKTQSKWFGWKESLQDGTPSQEVAKVVIHAAPIDGAGCFWNLPDWQCVSGVSQTADWLTKGMKKWQEMCRQKLDLPASFFRKRSMSEDSGRFTSHAHSVATEAIVFFFVSSGVCVCVGGAMGVCQAIIWRRTRLPRLVARVCQGSRWSARAVRFALEGDGDGGRGHSGGHLCAMPQRNLWRHLCLARGKSTQETPPPKKKRRP